MHLYLTLPDVDFIHDTEKSSRRIWIKSILSFDQTIAGYKLRIFNILLYLTESHMLYLRLRALATYIDKHYIGFSNLLFSHAVAAELSFDPFDSEIKIFLALAKLL
jgi:hypothetical protein